MVLIMIYLSLSAYYWDFYWIFGQFAMWDPVSRGMFIPYLGALVLLDYVLGKWYYETYVLPGSTAKTTKR